VGVSSYLLIGFYYTKKEAVAASKKAFIVTRFADLGFLVGILFYGYYAGTFSFTPDVQLLAAAGAMIPLALGLMFIGGAGKSAMFPLHIWLPDAMEGPTPVSALIHAATMVVAGVYLVARMFPLFVGYAPEVLHWTAYIGAFTALYAAVVACVQSDIKRVQAVQYHFADRLHDRGAGRLHLRLIPIRAGWGTWPRCSTSSRTPCSRRCCSSAPGASSMPCTPTKCRPWAACADTCP